MKLVRTKTTLPAKHRPWNWEICFSGGGKYEWARWFDTKEDVEAYLEEKGTGGRFVEVYSPAGEHYVLED